MGEGPEKIGKLTPILPNVEPPLKQDVRWITLVKRFLETMGQIFVIPLAPLAGLAVKILDKAAIAEKQQATTIDSSTETQQLCLQRSTDMVDSLQVGDEFTIPSSPPFTITHKEEGGEKIYVVVTENRASKYRQKSEVINILNKKIKLPFNEYTITTQNGKLKAQYQYEGNTLTSYAIKEEAGERHVQRIFQITLITKGPSLETSTFEVFNYFKEEGKELTGKELSYETGIKSRHLTDLYKNSSDFE